VKLSPQAAERYRLQDYGGASRIDGVEIVELRRFNDDGGSLTELVRLAGAAEAGGLPGFRVAQINWSRLEPGVVKAFHLHRRQTDVWFVPPEDRLLLLLIDVRAGSPSEGARMRLLLGDGASRLVRIPPGVAHGCRNLGSAPARILYFTDLHFSADPQQGDEGRLPWDFAGREVWDVRWE
jgi:dTDP-4-dehydrorhamnose 3,5-epimerase